MTMSHYSPLSSGSSNSKHAGKHAGMMRAGSASGGTHQGRWYDNVPELRQAVFLMEGLPHGIQVVMCQLISVSLRGESRKLVPSSQLRQYGAEKIMGLMKSRAKNRWYDREANIHKAFNDIYLSEDSKWRDTSLRIIVSIAQLQRAGVENLSEKTIASLILETFHCNQQTLQEKAHESLEFLALPEPESVPTAITGSHDLQVTPLLGDTKQVDSKTASRSISKGGDRLLIDELRQLKKKL